MSWPGARRVPSIEQQLRAAAPDIGAVRARCKPAQIRKPCVVEFDRVSQARQVEIARAIEKMGYRVVGGATDSKGPRKFASDIRFVPRKG